MSIWMIVGHPKRCSRGLGIFYTILAVVRLAAYARHQGPRLDVGDLPIAPPTVGHVVYLEVVWLGCALACFIVHRDLIKIPEVEVGRV